MLLPWDGLQSNCCCYPSPQYHSEASTTLRCSTDPAMEIEPLVDWSNISLAGILQAGVQVAACTHSGQWACSLGDF